MTNTKKKYQANGFFLIEVVVVASVVAVVLILLLSSVQNSVEAAKRSLERTQASFILEEGAEAIKSIRDLGWQENIATLENDQKYYLAWQNNKWSLVTDDNNAALNGQFTRSLVFSPVYRDEETGKISETGTILDAGSKKVLINVSWASVKGEKNEEMYLIITNIR